MTGEIFDNVLPLAIGLGGRCGNDMRALLKRALIVSVDILNPHHDAAAGARVRICNDDGPIANIQLRTVIGDAKAHRETEGSAQPIDRYTHVGIAKLWNHCGMRHRSIHKHLSIIAMADNILRIPL